MGIISLHLDSVHVAKSHLLSSGTTTLTSLDWDLTSCPFLRRDRSDLSGNQTKSLLIVVHCEDCHDSSSSGGPPEGFCYKTLSVIAAASWRPLGQKLLHGRSTAISLWPKVSCVRYAGTTGHLPSSPVRRWDSSPPMESQERLTSAPGLGFAEPTLPRHSAAPN